MKPLWYRRRRSAVSITELLIAVLIVALLFVLAMPIASSVRSRMLEAKCVWNLRQLGAAVMSHSAEHQGRILPHYRLEENGQTLAVDERTWPAVLIKAGYVENLDLFYCPAYYPYHNRTPGIANLRAGGGGLCYGMRAWRIPGANYHLSKSDYKKLSVIAAPSEFFLLADSYWITNKGQGYVLQPGAVDGNQFLHLRHRDRANLFFADGSVRSYTRADVEKINQTQAEYGNGAGFPCWPKL